MKSAAYWAGFEAKQDEIAGMGFEASRDKLNMDYPVGVAYVGSKDGFDFMQGQADALLHHVK